MKVFKKFISIFLERREAVISYKSIKSVEQPNIDQDYYFGFVEREELGSLDYPRFTIEQIQRKQDKGDLFVVARRGGANLCFSWIEFGDVQIPLLKLRTNLLDNWCYLSGAYVPPQHRGHRSMQKLVAWTEQYLFYKFGKISLLWVTNPFNLAASKSMQARGFIPVLSVRLLRVLFVKFYFYKVLPLKISRFGFGLNVQKWVSACCD